MLIATPRAFGLQYDGTNSADLLDLLTSALPSGWWGAMTWSIASETGGVLAIRPSDLSLWNDLVLNVDDYLIFSNGYPEVLTPEYYTFRFVEVSNT